MSEARTYVVLLGVPGAGKGTQAKLLEQSTGLPQVSTGDIFRYNLKNQTELGKLARPRCLASRCPAGWPKRRARRRADPAGKRQSDRRLEVGPGERPS